MIASDDATLQSLIVDYLIDEIITNNAPIDPEFSPDTTSYTAGVPSGVAVAILSAVATEPGAELVVTRPDGSTQEDTGDADEIYGDVSPGLNTFTVKVTAPDGIAMQVYTVIVDRGGGLNGWIENLPSSHDGNTAFYGECRVQQGHLGRLDRQPRRGSRDHQRDQERPPPRWAAASGTSR